MCFDPILSSHQVIELALQKAGVESVVVNFFVLDFHLAQELGFLRFCFLQRFDFSSKRFDSFGSLETSTGRGFQPLADLAVFEFPQLRCTARLTS